jgi:hypothetical protein
VGLDSDSLLAAEQSHHHFFESHEIGLLHILTNRGTDYCCNPDRRGYELHMAVENVDHSCTEVKSPQTNGIVEWLHKTMLDVFYRVALRRTIYRSIDELPVDLEVWVEH